MSTLEQRFDHARDLAKHDISPRHQKRAVVDLVGYCYGLIGIGILSPEIEKQLHTRMCTVCSEFEMDKPPLRERASA